MHHPFQVIEGELEGVEQALNMPKRSEVRGIKFAFEIDEEA